MPPRSSWPFLVPALLITAAVAVGGVAGVILGFVAALLLVDRLIDRAVGQTASGAAQAEYRFLRLARERRLATLGRRLRRRPKDSNDLDYLAEDVGWAAVAQRRRLGVQTIPVLSVVGTVDRHKAAAFDREFRPPGWSRGRWTLMYRAVLQGKTLPPISVVRVGDEHYVSDGHHRVSVARALGVAGIEADVTELRRPSNVPGRRVAAVEEGRRRRAALRTRRRTPSA
jgi:hypothetical protein